MPDLSRPRDDDYYVAPWSEDLLQGDVFSGVRLGFALPPDATIELDGDRRFLSGPFEPGLALLTTPTGTMAPRGDERQGAAARTLVPIRSLAELMRTGAVEDWSVERLRTDRLRSYLYLPADDPFGIPEGAALLDEPITLHQDVIRDGRIAQLTGTAFRHLRVKLMAHVGGFLLDPDELGPPPGPRERIV